MRIYVAGLIALAVAVAVGLSARPTQIRWAAKQHCLRAGFRQGSGPYLTCLAQDRAASETIEPEWDGVPVSDLGG